MPSTIVTIHTDSVLKREAQTYFESQGLTLETGLNAYFKLLSEQEDDTPLVLHQIADKDVPQEVRDTLKEYEAVPKEDLLVLIKKDHAH